MKKLLLLFILLSFSLVLPSQTLLLWLDGADPENDGTPPANGSTITTWSDKSGNGHDATGGISPSYNSTGLNSIGTVSFTGSEYLESTFDWETTFNLGDPYVAFTVFIPTDFTDNRVMWAGRPGNGPSHAGTATITGRFQGRSYSGTPFLTSTLTANTGYLGTFGSNSTTSSLFLNLECAAETPGTYGAFNVGFSTSVGANISSIGGISNFFIGEIAEIRIYDGGLTTTQITNIETELTNKWGLCIVLPVELTDFSGVALQDKIQLSWQTASEYNNSGFEIEHGNDARNWTTIDFVKGEGTTFEQQSYSLIHSSPHQGLNYYRLKQLDFDGQFTYSPIISVNHQSDLSHISLFPNPVRHVVTLHLQTDFTGKGAVHLYGPLGQLVQRHMFLGEGIKTNYSFDLDGLAAGVYLAIVQIGPKKWEERLVVKN